MDIQSQINQLKNQIEELQKSNDVLQEKYNTLEQKYSKLSETKNEMYYQKFLERKMLATHQKTAFGITDITTKNEHIEIKHWRNYKSALGQLLSYNFYDNKDLCAYFFGQVPDKQCSSIIELYKSKGVSIKQFIDAPDGIEIKTVLDTNKESVETKNTQLTKGELLSIWFNNNIIYKQDGKISLKEMCLSYFSYENIGVKEKSKFKKEIEKCIKKKFSNIDYICQKTTINTKSFKGWLHLGLKDVN